MISCENKDYNLCWCLCYIVLKMYFYRYLCFFFKFLLFNVKLVEIILVVIIFNFEILKEYF